jgi:DNA repair protein RecN (Recombination protein N)
MLRQLRIRNFTIIDDLSIDIEGGLTILTGETGAGKSIIADALGLLLGDKASQHMIRTGQKEAHIEAYFDATHHPMLDELSIDSSDGIIIRRGIGLQGKGRAYANDVPVSVQTLSSIGTSLVDIHGQHEHQGLLKKETHILFLDTLGGLLESVRSLQSAHDEVLSIGKTVARMKERISERAQRTEFLKFQINEIDAARLRRGEREEIEEERGILLNLTRLKESSATAYRMLYESEGSCLEQLSMVINQIRDMVRIDHSARELLSLLESASPLVQDASLLLRTFKDKYEMDPQRLAAIDERLELLKKLEKKYGQGMEEILLYRSTAEEELKGLEEIDEQLETLEGRLKKREALLLTLAEDLSGTWQAVARNAEATIIGELRKLGFEKADFKIEIKKRETVAADGMDDVEFLFSANPGEVPKPLVKVASGGELSRIMLALKCLFLEGSGEGLTEQKTFPPAGSSPLAPTTLIFDEVDAGIGGVTARRVGERLKSLAGSFQVLCISHLPQIAAVADHHLKVEKVIVGEAVKVSVEPLSGERRQREIAQMLSGRVTDGALRHAGELLGVKKRSGQDETLSK